MVTGPQRRQQALISRVGQDVGISIAPPTTFLAFFSPLSIPKPFHSAFLFFFLLLFSFLIYISLIGDWNLYDALNGFYSRMFALLRIEVHSGNYF